MSMNYLTEAFKELKLLDEGRTFNFDEDGAVKMANFLEDDVLDDYETIIDPEATTEEELQPTYVGNVILGCETCHSMIYKAPEDVVVDEETQLANVGELCPYCFTTDGFKLVGKVAPFEEVTVDVQEKDEYEPVEEGDVTSDTVAEALHSKSSPRYFVNKFFEELGIPKDSLSVRKGPYSTTMVTVDDDEYRITVPKKVVEKYVDEDTINQLSKGQHPLIKKYNVVTFGADWTPYSMRAWNYPLVYEAIIKAYTPVDDNSTETSEGLVEGVIQSNSQLFEKLNTSEIDIITNDFHLRRYLAIKFSSLLNQTVIDWKGHFLVRPQLEKVDNESDDELLNRALSKSANGFEKVEKFIDEFNEYTQIIKNCQPALFHEVNRWGNDQYWLEIEVDFGDVKSFIDKNQEAIRVDLDSGKGYNKHQTAYDSLYNDAVEEHNKNVELFYEYKEKLLDSYKAFRNKYESKGLWDVKNYPSYVAYHRQHFPSNRLELNELSEHDILKYIENWDFEGKNYPFGLINIVSHRICIYGSDAWWFHNDSAYDGTQDVFNLLGASGYQDYVKDCTKIANLLKSLQVISGHGPDSGNHAKLRDVDPSFEKDTSYSKHDEIYTVFGQYLAKAKEDFMKLLKANGYKVNTLSNWNNSASLKRGNYSFTFTLKNINDEDIEKIKELAIKAQLEIADVTKHVSRDGSPRKNADDTYYNVKFGVWAPDLYNKGKRPYKESFSKPVTWVCMFDEHEIGTVEACSAEEAYELMEANYPEYAYGLYDGVADVFPADTEIRESISLSEGMENISITTDNEVITVNSTVRPEEDTATSENDVRLTEGMEDISITTGDEVIKIKSTPRADKEEIAPLSETEVEEIAAEPQETEEVAEPTADDIEIEEIDEVGFDELGESYLKKVYENVESFKTVAGKRSGAKIILEGVIKFNSGKKAKTSFVFENRELTKRGKLRLFGENVNIAANKGAFILTGRNEGKKLICEAFTYNYNAKDAKDGSSKKLYGTVRK